MSAVVDISYWFDLRFLLTTTSNRNQSQCSSSFSLLNCCCMCQQDVLQRKIIICAKLHVFLSMCHTMQWSNGLTFFITEDLHFDEKFIRYFSINISSKQEFQPIAIVCQMRIQLKCRVEVTASWCYFYKLFPAFLYSSSSFFLDHPQTILLQDNDTFSKMTDVKMACKKIRTAKNDRW